MSPEMVYALLGLMAILVVYFAYQSYMEYKKNPTRWALRELVVEWVGKVL